MVVNYPPKKVRFNPQLVLSSPTTKHQLTSQFISFGSFEMTVDLSGNAAQPLAFGSALNSTHNVASSSASSAFLVDDLGFIHTQSNAHSLAGLSQLVHSIETSARDQFDSFAQIQELASTVQAHLANPSSSHDQGFSENQHSGHAVLKSALKKSAPFENLNLSSSFLTRDQDDLEFKNSAVVNNSKWASSPEKNFNGDSLAQGNRELSLFNSLCFWRCLRRGHSHRSCIFQVRCLNCFNYGHWAKYCFSKSIISRGWIGKPKAPTPRSTQSSPVIRWRPRIPIVQAIENPLEQSLENTVHTPPQESQEAGALTSQATSSATHLYSESPTGCEDELTPHCSSPLSSPPSDQEAAIANFMCDPTLYLPLGAHVEDGWQRPACSWVAISGEPPRCHKEYAIVSMEPAPHPIHARATLTNVVNFLENQYPVRIFSSFLSPLGLGLLEFGSSVMRQSMIDISPIPFDGVSVLRVAKHDEAKNLRSCPYTRECWIMFLTFPLDYQREEFSDAAIAPFGRRLYWHKGPNKTRSLIKCLILAPECVPRSVVISRGSSMGGASRSWSAPTFILGGEFVDQLIVEEDALPPDGNPHPAHGAPLQGNLDVFQNWMHDLAGAGAQVLANAGLNVKQVQDIDMELHPNLHNDVAANADDLNLNGNVDIQMDEAGEAHENEVPHHPDQPQDTLSFDQSGSTVNYLRATGPDIHLMVEEVLAGIQNSGGSSSGDSGAVSSIRIMTVRIPEFIVNAC